MNDIKIFYIAILITVIINIIDIIKFKACNNKESIIDKTNYRILTFLHHFVIIFIMCGIFFKTKKWVIAYILFIVILFIHWHTNNNKCILSELKKNMCKNSPNKNTWSARFKIYSGISKKLKDKIMTPLIIKPMSNITYIYNKDIDEIRLVLLLLLSISLIKIFSY